MSLVKFVQGKEDNLPSIAETGAIYFTTDECIYLGLADGTYKVYGNFTTVNTVDDLPEVSNEFVLFYIKEENALYKYDNENLVWAQVTVDTSTTYGIVNGETKGSIVVTATNSDDEIVSQETIQVVDVDNLEESINQNTTDISALDAKIQETESNIKEYVDQSVSNVDVRDKLSDYYKKTETYSQSEVDALVSVISTYDTEVVTSLPTENISETTVYLLVTDNGDGTSIVTSYVYDNNTWIVMTEQKQDIGDMSIHWGTF